MAERRGVLVGLVLAAVLLWASSRLVWVAAVVSDDLRGTRDVELVGSAWSGELVALALAALAAVAAVLAVRGRWVVRAVAAVVVLIGVAGCVPPLRLLGTGASVERTSVLLDAGGAQVSTEVRPLGALLALAGGLVCVAAGLLLLRVPGRARGLSDRYRTPGARREAQTGGRGTGDGNASTRADGVREDDDVHQRRLWDALDAGVDPTVDPTGDEGAGAPESPARDTPTVTPAHPSITLSRQPSTDRGDGGSIP